MAFQDGFELLLDAADGVFVVGFKTQHQNRRGIGCAHQAEAV